MHNTGVYISLNETLITNNSHIIINRRNKNDRVTLLCHTDNTSCCLEGQGQWYITLLDGEKINKPENLDHAGFTVNRNDGIVSITFDTTKFGIFCCQVPDADGIEETTCINSG